jgi:hypothetical protein
MSTLAIVDDLGSSVCLEQMGEMGEYQGKEGAKIWISRSLCSHTNLGGIAQRMEQQLDRRRATIGNI